MNGNTGTITVVGGAVVAHTVSGSLEILVYVIIAAVIILTLKAFLKGKKAENLEEAKLQDEIAAEVDQELPPSEKEE